MNLKKEPAFLDLKSGIVLSDLTDDPRCGDTYAMFLICEDRLLATRGFPRTPDIRLPVQDALGIDKEEWRQARQYSAQPSDSAFVLWIANGKKLGLLYPVPDVSGAMIGVMPFGGEKSILRVLRHTFPQYIVQSERLGEEVTGELRAEDELTVVWLAQLLRRLRCAVGGEMLLEVRNRHTLSRWILRHMLAFSNLLGAREIVEKFEEFTIPIPFHGVVSCGCAMWMMDCLIWGISELVQSRTVDIVASVPDRELLLPTIDIAVGNRTPLPDIWRECDDIARERGMFFEVCRHRDSIRVRFCPLIPSESSIYEVRAPYPWGETV